MVLDGGYRSLALAVIERAFRDCCMPFAVKDKHGKRHIDGWILRGKTKTKVPISDYLDAMRFLHGPNDMLSIWCSLADVSMFRVIGICRQAVDRNATARRSVKNCLKVGGFAAGAVDEPRTMDVAAC